MLGFDALSAAALPGEESPGSVPRANSDQANFAFTGTAYTPTTDFAFGSAGPFVANGAATLDLFVDAAATHTSVLVAGDGAATVPIDASAAASHGIAGSGVATITLDAADTGAHGIAGPSAGTLALDASATASHGIAGSGDATLTFPVSAAGTHPRYEVRGEVREAGVLVNRRVRVHLRSTGAVIGEADTEVGRFAIHTGFAPAEHYLVPINLADDATDWTPPVANRVVSVLAQDA